MFALSPKESLFTSVGMSAVEKKKNDPPFFSDVPLLGDTLRRAIHAAEKRGEILKCGWKNSFLWG